MEVSRLKITMNAQQPFKAVIFVGKDGYAIQGWDGEYAM